MCSWWNIEDHGSGSLRWRIQDSGVEIRGMYVHMIPRTAASTDRSLQNDDALLTVRQSCLVPQLHRSLTILATLSYDCSWII